MISLLQGDATTTPNTFDWQVLVTGLVPIAAAVVAAMFFKWRQAEQFRHEKERERESILRRQYAVWRRAGAHIVTTIPGWVYARVRHDRVLSMVKELADTHRQQNSTWQDRDEWKAKLAAAEEEHDREMKACWDALQQFDYESDVIRMHEPLERLINMIDTLQSGATNLYNLASDAKEAPRDEAQNFATALHHVCRERMKAFGLSSET